MLETQQSHRRWSCSTPATNPKRWRIHLRSLVLAVLMDNNGYEMWISYLYFLPTMHVWFWTLPDGYAGHAAIKHLVAKIPLKRPDRRLWSGVESWTWQLLGSIHIPKASYGCHNTAKCAKTCYCKIWSFCRPGEREVYKKTFSEIFSAAATSDWGFHQKVLPSTTFPICFLLLYKTSSMPLMLQYKCFNWNV